MNQNLSRRNFLKRSSLTLASATAVNSLGLASLLNASNCLAGETDYKALVFIFLAGGNDSFNMISPKGSGSLRNNYEQGRRALALPAENLHSLQLRTPAQIYGGETFNDFGMHPACSNLANMFNDQELSVLCNIGNLTTPTTRAQYFAKEVSLPPQLFSHADQQRQFQSDANSPFRFGWGGRMAELLNDYNANGSVSPLISVSGLNSFQVTKNSIINPYVMSNDGVATLKNFTGNRQHMVESSMNSIDSSAHLMVQKYRSIFSSARNAEDIVDSAFRQAAATGVDYDQVFETAGAATSKIGRRLKTVAKMIAGRQSTGNNRPIFFVEMNGFDTHQNLLSDHNELMTELSTALKAFSDVLKAQGDFEDVLSFVGSEFGRTLTPNGNDSEAGTDHAWGGHALVMGGMINGGQFFGTHPDLKLQQGLDASEGRGRWIPTTATTQASAIIANWFGVPQNDLPQLFPSLNNFASPFEPEANLNFIKTGVA